ncbi:MAG: patatin-like phospholipase family protein [Bdellovibrionota bacterium]
MHLTRAAQPLNRDSTIRNYNVGPLGLVLSGGGSRTAYQVGALKALAKVIDQENDRLSIIVGSSIGAVNTVVLANCIQYGLGAAVEELHNLWRERTFRNTFEGSPSRTFLKAIQVALLRYSSPGPIATSLAIFNPAPLRERIDQALSSFQQSALAPNGARPDAAAVMVTVEGKERRPLLLVSSKDKIDPERFTGVNFSVSYIPTLTAAHGLASAALPSVLPPVELNVEAGQVRLVDGGICDNVPVDPAVRLGAERVITIDASGRRWWFDHYQEPHDTRPDWEVAALEQTYCMFPTATFELVNSHGLGKVLEQTAGRSTRDFITALGPTWPIFKILQHKMGSMLAYEVMSYVALHPGYFEALLDLGYQETMTKLEKGYPVSVDNYVPAPGQSVG